MSFATNAATSNDLLVHPETMQRAMTLLKAGEGLNAVNELKKNCDPRIQSGRESRLKREYLDAVHDKDCTVNAAISLKAGATSISAEQFVVATESARVKTEEAQKALDDKQGSLDWAALGWGVGVGVSFGKETVDGASIDGTPALVHVTSTRKNVPRVLLEFHTYPIQIDGPRGTLLGLGLFAAAASSDNKVLSGVGFGFMTGIRTGTGNNTNGFSIGIGGILDAKVKELAAGFSEGQAAPSGETAVRFVEKTRGSGVVFFTKTF
jgi:hypothetical protein